MPKTKRHIRAVGRETPKPVVSDGIDESAITSDLVSSQEIAQRAYLLYEARGCEEGHDLDDWLQAERELLRERRSTTPVELH